MISNYPHIRFWDTLNVNCTIFSKNCDLKIEETHTFRKRHCLSEPLDRSRISWGYKCQGVRCAQLSELISNNLYAISA